MSLTPAQRVRMRKLAATATTTRQRDPYGETTGTAYELMQAQLHGHMRTLKAIQSTERKIEAKRTMIGDFTDYLAGVLSADAGGQDVVLVTLLVWHLDVGSYASAIALGEYALRHDLEMPDQYKRNLPTVLIEELSDAVIAGKATGVDALTYLYCVEEIAKDRDTHDQVRAKLHKAIGWALIGKTATQDAKFDEIPKDRAASALTHLQRAIELHAQAGVKKDVERLERRVRG